MQSTTQMPTNHESQQNHATFKVYICNANPNCPEAHINSYVESVICWGRTLLQVVVGKGENGPLLPIGIVRSLSHFFNKLLVICVIVMFDVLFVTVSRVRVRCRSCRVRIASLLYYCVLRRIFSTLLTGSERWPSTDE